MSEYATALLTLYNEILNGPGQAAFVLNPGDSGLLQSLDRLSADQASAVPPEGGASVASHVDHICFGLELMVRWAQGEKDPFTGADFRVSWDRKQVSASEWSELRDRLWAVSDQWRQAMQQPRTLTDTEAAGLAGSVVHLAYHLGAMRQMNRQMRGPSA
jgi:hypothetical protein